MRLPLLPPSSLSSEQQELYDDIMDVVKERFGSFIVTREYGALIGPFNLRGSDAPTLASFFVDGGMAQV